MRAFNAVKFAGWIHAIGFLAQVSYASKRPIIMCGIEYECIQGDPAPDLQSQCLMKSAFLRGILVGSRAQ